MAVKFPSALPMPRVPRSRRDDHYQKGHPMCHKAASIGIVTSIEDDTVTVLVSDEQLSGVIPLGKMPPVDAIVEIESRCDLLVILDWAEPEPGGPITLHTGPVTLRVNDWLPGVDTPHVDSTVVGSPPQWDDGSDATYALVHYKTHATEGWGSYDHAVAPVDVLGPGEVTAISITMRVSSSGTGTRHPNVYLYPAAVGPQGATYAYVTPVTFVADGSVHEISTQWEDDEEGDPNLAQAAVALQDGAILNIRSGVFGHDLTIHDVVITATLGDAPALMLAATVEEPVEQTIMVAADWVQSYVGDGTKNNDPGASQGVLDRDTNGDPVVGWRGHERALVGFPVTLPSDADIRSVTLRVPWTDWWYANGVGALVLGWHDHATAPDTWSARAPQLSTHDVAETTLDLTLAWAPAALRSGFAGLAIGPGWNDGGLYAGHTDTTPDQWQLSIRYLSREVQ